MLSLTQNALFALAASAVLTSAMPAQHKHHVHEKRDAGTCAFPTDAGLVAVTPNSANGGWAMSPDQSCTPGSYCPYACPPGQLMAQWDPSSTSYTYPGSMNGGLYCNSDGTVSKPFPNKPYCYDGQGTYQVDNQIDEVVSFCQTVLPGNEAMLIPTEVSANSQATLAVPGSDYWAQTAAHYYINPPGIDTSTACVWGSSDNNWGNWAPFVAGANEAGGETFVTLGWNPIYLEPTAAHRNVVPDFGVRITCPDGNCNGLPCEIDPSVSGVNGVTSNNGNIGAGGAGFCVVTARDMSKAKLEVFRTGSSASTGSSVKAVVGNSTLTGNGTIPATFTNVTVSSGTPEATAVPTNEPTGAASAAGANTLLGLACAAGVLVALL